MGEQANGSVNDISEIDDDPAAGWDQVMSKASYARYRRAIHGSGSKSGITKYIAQGKIGPPALRPDGRIDRIIADAQLSRTLDAAKKRAAVPSTIPPAIADDGADDMAPPPAGTLAAEQVALTRARRQRIEQEMKRESGRLVDKAEVERTTFDAGRRVRDRLLAVPDRIAAELVGKSDREIRAALRDALANALNEAAADLEGVEDASENPERN